MSEPMRMSRFRHLKKIGEGGYGSVHLIEEKTTGKKYILKRLIRGDKSTLEAQFRNLRALREACSAFFVCPRAMVMERGQLFLIMDYLDGFIELFDLIDQKRYGLDKSKAQRIAKNLIRGLRVMHDLGIAHRDIKPENIMVHPRTLEIRYIDFGMACVGDEDCTHKKIHSGTRGYIAPEIYLHPVSKPTGLTLQQMQKTDLFSLGVVLGIMFHPEHRIITDELVEHFRLPNELWFYKREDAARILKKLNTSLVAEPLGSSTIRLLEMDPAERTLGRVQMIQNRQMRPQTKNNKFPSLIEKTRPARKTM